jgi:hypothetical protein
MIVNPEIFGDSFFYKSDNKAISDYLIYELHVPLLGTKNGEYYFTNNELLKECLKKLPLHLKIIGWINRKIQ